MKNIDKTEIPPIGYHNPNLDPPEPRWPALVAAFVVGLLHMAIPPSLTLGPSWLVGTIVGVLAIPSVVTHRRQARTFNRIVGYTISTVLTFFLIYSVARLLIATIGGHEDAHALLVSAAALWVGNIMIFALWYWRLDGGGPNGRDITPGHRRGAFLFPQMTEEGENSREVHHSRPLWSPQFIDYLFLAFNTSTAFSPTDAPVLSRWAKGLTMIQASISLSVTVLLAARAVNILPSN